MSAVQDLFRVTGSDFNQQRLSNHWIPVEIILPYLAALRHSLQHLNVDQGFLLALDDVTHECCHIAGEEPKVSVRELMRDLRMYGVIPYSNETTADAAKRLHGDREDVEERMMTLRASKDSFSFDPLVSVDAVTIRRVLGQISRRTTEAAPNVSKLKLTMVWHDEATAAKEPPSPLFTPLDPEVVPAPQSEFPRILKIKGRSGDRYQLRAYLGEGGLGTVYRAYDLVLKRPVAIKVYRKDRMRKAPQTREFYEEHLLKEAQYQANTNSKYIVEVYDYGATEEEGSFIVMQLMKETLLDHLNAIHRGDRPFELKKMLRLAEQILAGLMVAHTKMNCIHRDIKPENIFIYQEDNTARLGDFGGALEMHQTKTMRTKAFGTPIYMSPAGLYGATDGPREDIYAVGVMLFEMIAGYTPYDVIDDLEVLRKKKVNEGLPRVSEIMPHLNIPPEIDLIIERATASDGRQRYQTAEEMQIELLTYKARPLEIGADKKDEEAKKIITAGSPDLEQYSVLRDECLGLLSGARDEYEDADRRFQLKPIQQRIALIHERIAEWAADKGDHRVRAAAARGLARFDSDSPAVEHIQRSLVICLNYDDYDGDRKNLRVQVGKFEDRRGILTWAGLDSPFTGLSRDVTLDPGLSYVIRVDDTTGRFRSTSTPAPSRVARQAHDMRIPFYRNDRIPKNWLIASAGHVIALDNAGRFGQRSTRGELRTVPNDIAFGPKPTNREHLFFLIRYYYEKVATCEDSAPRDQALQKLSRMIPIHWSKAMRDKIMCGEGEQIDRYEDCYGGELNSDSAVTGITHAETIAEFLAATYPEFPGIRPSTLDEWKRILRGNDARRFPWGDALRRGITNWRFPGYDEVARIYANNEIYHSQRIGDVSPWSLYGETGLEMGIGFLVGGTHNRMTVTTEKAALILEKAGHHHVDAYDPEQLAQWVFLVATPYIFGAPDNIEIAVPFPIDDVSTLTRTSFIPVLPLEPAVPSPDIETLLE